MLNKLQTGFAADLQRASLHDLKNIILPGKFDSNELMQVYRNNYYISLTEALRSVYVSVDKLVGKGFFDFVAHGYIEAHPSRSGNLHELGGEFETYIGALEQAASVPYIADVAKLDWAWHRMFHAEDSNSLAIDVLVGYQHKDFGALCFQLVPACQILKMDYTVFGLWNHCREIPGFESSDELSYENEQQFIMIYRSGLDVVVAMVSQAKALFIEKLREGMCLADVAELAMEVDTEFQLPDALQSLFVQEVVSGIELPTENNKN